VWCDTPYAVFYDDRKAQLHRDRTAYDPKIEIHRITPEVVANRVADLVPHTARVVISGGEPLLQRNVLPELLFELAKRNFFDYEIETAGTIAPPDSLAYTVLPQTMQWNVSPKLAHSMNEYGRRYHPVVLRKFADIGADFKFVCKTADDFQQVQDIVSHCGIEQENIWIMPEGITKGDVMWNARHFRDEVLRRGWNLTLRQQILMFDSMRGV
jgi:organic radical activating enzyme